MLRKVFAKEIMNKHDKKFIAKRFEIKIKPTHRNLYHLTFPRRKYKWKPLDRGRRFAPCCRRSIYSAKQYIESDVREDEATTSFLNENIAPQAATKWKVTTVKPWRKRHRSGSQPTWMPLIRRTTFLSTAVIYIILNGKRRQAIILVGLGCFYSMAIWHMRTGGSLLFIWNRDRMETLSNVCV